MSPYLPVNLSPEIERKIERVLILAEQPSLKRPFAAATVLDALPKACEHDAALCADVRRYLRSLTRTVGLGHASVAVAGGSGADVPLPNRHGMRSGSNYEAAGSLYWQPSDHLLVSAGVVAYDGDTTPTGTVASFGREYLQVDIGYRDRWWSPLAESSMLFSTEAATLPSLTIGNYAPISRFGLRYEAFIAELSRSDRIRHLGAVTSGNPRLAGLHLSIEPFPGWSLGVNRVLQYGGGNRADSFSDLVRAFVDPSSDNIGSDDDPAVEFGNQTASFTAEFLVPTEVPLRVYFEYAGEDTSTTNNLRLGNVALAAGVTIPKLLDRFSATFEISEWQNAWYEHHVYLDGLRHEGAVIGHWGGDWRQAGDAVGAVSALARLGWQTRRGAFFEATYRTLANENYATRSYERAHLLDLRFDHPWRDLFIGGELHAGHDSFGESFSRVAAFIRF